MLPASPPSNNLSVTDHYRNSHTRAKYNHTQRYRPACENFYTPAIYNFSTESFTQCVLITPAVYPVAFNVLSAGVEIAYHTPGLHKQEVVRWCLNVCVTVVTRNSADSHQKNNNIHSRTVVCSVMHSTVQVLTEHFLQSVQRFQFFMRPGLHFFTDFH